MKIPMVLSDSILQKIRINGLMVKNEKLNAENWKKKTPSEGTMKMDVSHFIHNIFPGLEPSEGVFLARLELVMRRRSRTDLWIAEI